MDRRFPRHPPVHAACQRVPNFDTAKLGRILRKRSMLPCHTLGIYGAKTQPSGTTLRERANATIRVLVDVSPEGYWMSWKNIFRDSLLDATKMGPRFFLDGLQALKRSSALKTVDIPGVGPVCIRPGDSDFSTLRQVFRNQDYRILIKDISDRIRRRYDALVSNGICPVIVDAGANIGAASLWFHQQYPEAAVVAIEPDPENVDLLRRNTTGKSIRVLSAAIGSEDGFVSMHNDGDSWAVQTTRADVGLKIVTVADAVRDVPNGELFIVKVDIEGFESDLFASNTDWIDQAFVVYVEPHDWLFPGKGTSRSFQKEMARRDFEILLRGENLIYIR